MTIARISLATILMIQFVIMMSHISLTEYVEKMLNKICMVCGIVGLIDCVNFFFAK